MLIASLRIFKNAQPFRLRQNLAREGGTEALRNADRGKNFADVDSRILGQSEKKKDDPTNSGDKSSTVLPNLP
jgi:hypothetical protein